MIHRGKISYFTNLKCLAIWGWFPLTMIPVRENSEVVIIYPDTYSDQGFVWRVSNMIRRGVCFTCESEESTPAWIKLLNDANGHPKLWGSISTVISTLPEFQLAVWQVVFSAELLGSYITPRTNWKQDRPWSQYVTISHNTRVSYDPKSCPTLDIYSTLWLELTHSSTKLG